MFELKFHFLAFLVFSPFPLSQYYSPFFKFFSFMKNAENLEKGVCFLALYILVHGQKRS
jgi:hypothetical protein